MTVLPQKAFLLHLRDRVRAMRLNSGLTQSDFAAKAGIAFATYRAFERSGRIAVERLYRIAVSVGRAHELVSLFEPPPAASIEELVSTTPLRKRGRRRQRPSP